MPLSTLPVGASQPREQEREVNKNNKRAGSAENWPEGRTGAFDYLLKVPYGASLGRKSQGARCKITTQ